MIYALCHMAEPLRIKAVRWINEIENNLIIFLEEFPINVGFHRLIPMLWVHVLKIITLSKLFVIISNKSGGRPEFMTGLCRPSPYHIYSLNSIWQTSHSPYNMDSYTVRHQFQGCSESVSLIITTLTKKWSVDLVISQKVTNDYMKV